MTLRVYKVGGPALEDPDLIAPLAAEVRVQERVLLVHGGGRHIERLLKALGIASRFVGGRRETSAEAMEVVEQVLSGGTNKTLAAGLTAAGVPAVGLSGRDGGLIRARLTPELGRVGTPDRIDPRVLHALWDAGLVPVVSPVSSGPQGEAVNVNADEAALALARALGAESLVYLSDVDGVRAETDTLEALTTPEAERLMDAGVITGGMAMKVRVALEAAEAGIAEVVVAGRARLVGGFRGTRVHAGAAR
jgi:acetylglutamate kinase